MNYFIENLIFIGKLLAPKINPKNDDDFNKRKLALILELNSINIINWLKNKPISTSNLIRIANRLSDIFNIEISPNDLLNNKIENIINSNYKSKKYQPLKISDNKNMIIDIMNLLNKYPEIQSPIHQLLIKYHQAHEKN